MAARLVIGLTLAVITATAPKAAAAAAAAATGALLLPLAVKAARSVVGLRRPRIHSVVELRQPWSYSKALGFRPAR